MGKEHISTEAKFRIIERIYKEATCGTDIVQANFTVLDVIASYYYNMQGYSLKKVANELTNDVKQETLAFTIFPKEVSELLTQHGQPLKSRSKVIQETIQSYLFEKVQDIRREHRKGLMNEKHYDMVQKAADNGILDDILQKDPLVGTILTWRYLFDAYDLDAIRPTQEEIIERKELLPNPKSIPINLDSIKSSEHKGLVYINEKLTGKKIIRGLDGELEVAPGFLVELQHEFALLNNNKNSIKKSCQILSEKYQVKVPIIEQLLKKGR